MQVLDTYLPPERSYSNTYNGNGHAIHHGHAGATMRGGAGVNAYVSLTDEESRSLLTMALLTMPPHSPSSL